MKYYKYLKYIGVYVLVTTLSVVGLYKLIEDNDKLSIIQASLDVNKVYADTPVGDGGGFANSSDGGDSGGDDDGL